MECADINIRNLTLLTTFGGIANGLFGPEGQSLKAKPGAQLAANTNDLGELVNLGAFQVTGSAYGTISTSAQAAISAAAAASAVYGWDSVSGRLVEGAPPYRLPSYTVRGSINDSRSAWQIGWRAALQGAAAFADGLNPFGNPMANLGYYDPTDPAFQISRKIGTYTGAIELGLLTFGAPSGTAVFYSGEAFGQPAWMLARQSGSILGESVAGQVMNLLEPALARLPAGLGETAKFWGWAGASGGYAFVNGVWANVAYVGNQAQGIWTWVERPILQALGRFP